MNTTDTALYAVIQGDAVIWQVVGFENGEPELVPLSRYLRDEDGAVTYRPVPRPGGQVMRPDFHDMVIYSPDYLSAAEIIKPWIKNEDES